jgi:hypothetical protein
MVAHDEHPTPPAILTVLNSFKSQTYLVINHQHVCSEWQYATPFPSPEKKPLLDVPTR